MSGKKVWLRTNGLVDNFSAEGVTVTPGGTLVDSEAKAKAIEESAARLGVGVVRMEDEPEPRPEDEQIVHPDPGAGLLVNLNQEDGK